MLPQGLINLRGKHAHCLVLWLMLGVVGQDEWQTGNAESVSAGSVAASVLFCIREFCLSIAPLNKSVFITSVSPCISLGPKR